MLIGLLLFLRALFTNRRNYPSLFCKQLILLIRFLSFSPVTFYQCQFYSPLHLHCLNNCCMQQIQHLFAKRVQHFCPSRDARWTSSRVVSFSPYFFFIVNLELFHSVRSFIGGSKQSFQSRRISSSTQQGFIRDFFDVCATLSCFNVIEIYFSDEFCYSSACYFVFFILTANRP